MNILYWTLSKNIIERTHKFPYNILFTFLMDRGRAPNGIGHLMILMMIKQKKWVCTKRNFRYRCFYLIITAYNTNKQSIF